jgi:hypothetical protein
MNMSVTLSLITVNADATTPTPPCLVHDKHCLKSLLLLNTVNVIPLLLRGLLLNTVNVTPLLLRDCY